MTGSPVSTLSVSCRSARPLLHLPLPLLLPLAHAVQAVTTALAPLGIPPSDFTPERMLITARWRTFSCSRAERLLGYKPVVPMSVREGSGMHQAQWEEGEGRKTGTGREGGWRCVGTEGRQRACFCGARVSLLKQTREVPSPSFLCPSYCKSYCDP